jgi:hypothetical protein
MIYYVITDWTEKMIPMQVEVTNEINTVCEYTVTTRLILFDTMTKNNSTFNKQCTITSNILYSW